MGYGYPTGGLPKARPHASIGKAAGNIRRSTSEDLAERFVLSLDHFKQENDVRLTTGAVVGPPDLLPFVGEEALSAYGFEAVAMRNRQPQPPQTHHFHQQLAQQPRNQSPDP